MSEQPVLFSEKACGKGKKIAIATLNAEKALNSLSLEMVDMISAQSELWEVDDSIVCILLDSAGDRAFAAGGDIRKLYESTMPMPLIFSRANIDSTIVFITFPSRLLPGVMVLSWVAVWACLKVPIFAW